MLLAVTDQPRLQSSAPNCTRQQNTFILTRSWLNKKAPVDNGLQLHHPHSGCNRTNIPFLYFSDLLRTRPRHLMLEYWAVLSDLFGGRIKTSFPIFIGWFGSLKWQSGSLNKPDTLFIAVISLFYCRKQSDSRIKWQKFARNSFNNLPNIDALN